MGQKIRLTWFSSDNRKIVEECLLVSEDDKLFYDTDEGLVEKTEEVWNSVVEHNYVLFEDDNGLFALRAEQIVSIENI